MELLPILVAARIFYQHAIYACDPNNVKSMLTWLFKQSEG